MTPEPKDADRFKNFLAFALVGAFISCIPLFVLQAIPAGNRDIVTYMVGQLSGMALTAIGYYFVNKAGQDALDTKRAETTGKMADAVVAAAASTPGDGSAAKGASEVAKAAADKADDIKESNQ